MTTTIEIPSIAGAPSTPKHWKQTFCPHITKWSEDGIPLEGSVGICYDIEENLETLFNKFNQDEEKLFGYLSKVIIRVAPHLSGSPKPMTRRQFNSLFIFLKFALGEQPYFLLRRGLKILGLFRKTSNYYYETPAPSTLQHRIKFVFVRELTISEEVRYYPDSQVPLTVITTPFVFPGSIIAKSSDKDVDVDTTLKRLTILRSHISSITTDLDSLISSLTTR